jgi:hypothetical protein
MPLGMKRGRRNWDSNRAYTTFQTKFPSYVIMGHLIVSQSADPPQERGIIWDFDQRPYAGI